MAKDKFSSFLAKFYVFNTIFLKVKIKYRMVKSFLLKDRSFYISIFS
jgi:hypothetical protein